MITIHALLILLAFICSLLSTFGVGARVNLLALSLTLFFLSLLIAR